MLLVLDFSYTRKKKSMQSVMRCGNTASVFHSISFFCVMLDAHTYTSSLSNTPAKLMVATFSH